MFSAQESAFKRPFDHLGYYIVMTVIPLTCTFRMKPACVAILPELNIYRDSRSDIVHS